MLTGELTLAVTPQASHTISVVLRATGIAVVVIAVVVFGIWLLSRKGPGPMG